MPVADGGEGGVGGGSDRHGEQGAGQPGQHPAGGEHQHDDQRVQPDVPADEEGLQHVRLDLVLHQQHADEHQGRGEAVGGEGDQHGQAAEEERAAFPVNTLGRALVQAGYQVVFAIPLLRAGDKGNFARGAGTAGTAALADHHAGHAKIADRIHQVSNGAPCYVRLGWEANKGYPWSYTNNGSGHDPADPATYRACWANTAAVWRDHCPAATLVWNHLKFPDGSADRITAYYPGDDAVDVLGIDPYDNGSYGYATDKAGFDKAILGINGSFPGWHPQTGRCQGLNGMLLFARSRGKKLSVCEWAPINKTKKYADPADNSYYVKAMHDFFAAHADDIAYESLFSGDGHELYPRVSYNSRASDSYRAAYRG